MIVTYPTPGAEVPLWRAVFEPADLPSTALLQARAEQYGLDVPEGYEGSNESPYLAAAAGAQLGTLLNFFSKKEASRIDGNFSLGPEGMRKAALVELCGAGSFFELSWMLDDFVDCKHLLSKEDLLYCVLYYNQLTPSRHAHRWLSHAAAFDIEAGNSGLLPVSNVRYTQNLLDHISGSGSEGQILQVTETLHMLLTGFGEPELAHLLRDVPLKDGELRIIALLRREMGAEVNVDTLVSEMRSMKPSWLNSLLA